MQSQLCLIANGLKPPMDQSKRESKGTLPGTDQGLHTSRSPCTHLAQVIKSNNHLCDTHLRLCVGRVEREKGGFTSLKKQEADRPQKINTQCLILFLEG